MKTPGLFDLFTEPVYLQSFGSSSSGNCTCIWDHSSTILVDCGFSASYIRSCLKKLGKTINEIDGLLITHIHSDHVNPSAVNMFLEHNIPLFCHEDVAESLFQRFGTMMPGLAKTTIRVFQQAPFVVADFKVQPIPLPHDADGGCFGYVFSKERINGALKIAIATDLSRTSKNLLNHFIDSDIVLLESNYDPDMLERSRRPAYLKRRIRESGHLSNQECASFLFELLKNSTSLPSTILLGHISAECNTNELALKATRTVLEENGFQHIRLVETYRNALSAIIEI